MMEVFVLTTLNSSKNCNYWQSVSSYCQSLRTERNIIGRFDFRIM